jgi:hypothetical protein
MAISSRSFISVHHWMHSLRRRRVLLLLLLMLQTYGNTFALPRSQSKQRIESVH